MIVDALGAVFLVFFIIVVIIILIPVIVVLFLYFKLTGNTLTFTKLAEGTKDFFASLIRRFQNGTLGAKKSQQPSTDSEGNRIEDAEFREID